MNKINKIYIALALATLGTSVFAQLATQGSDSPLSHASANQSKVVIYRSTTGFYATMRPAKIDLNGEYLGSLYQNNHMVFCVRPGTQFLGSHLEASWIYRDKNHRKQKINLEAGKTYYYRIQDDEREQFNVPTLVDKDRLIEETTSSQLVNAKLDNIEKSSIVPCASYIAQATSPPIETPKATPVVKEVTLSADALFQFDRSSRADILPTGKEKLDALANDLRAYDLQKINIIGYTDRLGDDSYNQRLSVARAETVRAYLAERGVPANVITAEGRGKAEAVAQCTQTIREELIKCLQPNRRVVLQVSGKVQLKELSK